MDKIKILFIIGTRPEAIKIAPIIIELYKYPQYFQPLICVTGQHRQMLDQVLDFFQITPDFDLNIMKHIQTLSDVTAACVKGIEKVLRDCAPNIVCVQGDTTSAFAGALSAFYYKIIVAHVEAGLRSGNKYSPYPEELNRVLISRLADLHFAPTEKARANLVHEGIDENIHVVGNTVIDALYLGLKLIEQSHVEKYCSFFRMIDFNKRIILITGHRRESFGEGCMNICHAIKQISSDYPDVEIVYPVHLNPNVREPVTRILNNVSNIHLIEPLEYGYFIWLLNKCFMVLTDSGGIQEEAPSLGKPVLVMRDVTERMEGIESGTAKLVGTSIDAIYNETKLILTSEHVYKKMSKAHNPYGDGLASSRIVQVISNFRIAK